MNRKNTIMLAVFINAGLLTILFIAAMSSTDEPAHSSYEVAEHPISASELPKPLFGDELDLNLRQAASQPQAVADAPVNVLPEPIQVPMQSEPVAHKLPPLVLQEPVVAADAPKPEPIKEVVVKKGDTLEKIAKNNKTTVEEILKANHLPNSFLRVGQVLKLPQEKGLASKTTAVKKPNEGNADYYTVKVGDNPWTIAMKHHLKVEELLRLNGLNEERARKLKPGDRLRIR